ncbi:MAG: holo-ACP synthase [Spirochaetaceae bacterium]|jgi:holo-[acyl-carrier protein] synthase|nr:holo-ACP synthase [Spirochaetaceae bacterium]
MIVGVGIDVVHVHRLERWRATPGLLARFFHPDELSAALSKGSGANLSLAARFAAKEAFGKALGRGLSGIILKDIMVVNRHNGKPEITLFGTALRAFKESGADTAHISLTHEKDNAIALVVLEGSSV